MWYAAFLLIQTDGPAAEAEASSAVEVLRPRATQVSMTADAAEAARLTAVRRAALPALEAIGRVLIEDVCVPRSRLADAAAALSAVANETGVAIYTFAHAADGNLHPIVVLSDHQKPTDQRVQDAADRIFRTALSLGGTVTGEHGVGILKRRWMGVELGEDVLDIQRRLKSVFDPRGILNPGRAI
ncbi:MAG TPA: FAD-linked oxidase C-terminal domain-containing protein [Pseudonocardiaceae bacterium]